MKLVLLLAIFFGMGLSSTVRADEFDDYLNQLETYRNDLNTHYANFIENNQKFSVNRFFTLTSVDHKVLALGLKRRAEEDLVALELLQNEFQVLQNDLQSNPSQVNVLAVSFFNLLSRAQRHLRFADTYLEDINKLAGSWSSYCEKEKLVALRQLFDPLAMFNPDKGIPFLAAPLTPRRIGFSISFNSDGDVNRTSPSEVEGASEGENAAWAVGAGVAAGFTAFCGGCGALIVAAVRVVVDVIRFGLGNDKIQKKEAKQASLISEIYDIQYNAMKSLGTTTESLLETTCKERYPAGQEWPLTEISDVNQKSQEIYSDISSFVHEGLAEWRKDYYKFLIDTYFPQVLQDYVQSVKGYYTNRVIVNFRAQEFAVNEVLPKVIQLNQSTGLAEKVRIQQNIWSQVIVGDAHFLEESELSFFQVSPISSLNPTFENQWKQLGLSILERSAL